MNEIIEKEINIEDMIYEIRGVQVMLSSDIAVKVNIKIIDAFVTMRKYFALTNSNNNILINHENRILALEDVLNKFKEENLNKILFENQLYDAYSILLDIFNTSKEEIIIVDNYASKGLLEILRKNMKVNIII